ncbi:MAG: hypothetical protein WC415_06445 [Patescibacteria group bacterium]|jgi:hypothetical protein
MMNVKYLKKNMIISNYKKLCEILEENIKTGGAKINQLNYWNDYFKYHKDGNKFIIDEIYDKEVENMKDNRGGNHNNIAYIDLIEKLILDLLVQDRNKGQVFLSKNRLLKELKMINDNYAYCKERIPKLSKFMNISEEDIQEFYESSGDTLKRNLENALDRLQKKSLVFWMPAKTVCIATPYINSNKSKEAIVHEVNTGLDEFGEETYEYNVNYRVDMKHRKATKEEIQLILHTEREILDEMGCEGKQQVIRFGMWDIFKEKVKNILMKEANILFYYNSYEVICNEDHIYKKWSELYDLRLEDKEKALSQMELNIGVVNRLKGNMENRNNKAQDKKDHIIGKIKDEKIIRRTKNNYLKDGENLINTLINKDSKSIKQQIKRVKINSNK